MKQGGIGNKLSSGSDLRAPCAFGVATLLTSIKPSVRTFTDDDVCLRLIDECIVHLRTRYGVKTEECGGRTGGDTSFTALVRLLLYVRSELVDELNDERCANLLQGCVEHLLTTHLHYPARSNGRSMHSMV